MTRRIITAAIVLTALWLIAVTCMLYTDVKLDEMNKELSARIDTIASDTDVRLGNMNMRLNDLEADMIKADKGKEIRQIRDEIRAVEEQIDGLREQIETPAEEPAEEPTEETTEGTSEVSEVPGTLVASAMVIKTENTYMEELGDDMITSNPLPTGNHITPQSGTFNFEGHTETYYNLDMSVVVQVAQSRGIAGEYHVREDGAKMLGDYIMVAADYSVHPYGSLVNTSLGMGIVVDTGGFIAWNPNGIDIATTW